MMMAQGRPLQMRRRGLIHVVATWLLLMGCALVGWAAAQDGGAPDQEAVTHRKLPPCAKPIEISSGDRALHDALKSMGNCDGTIIFTEPGARFAAIDALYRIYSNLTLDASGLSAPVTLGSDNRPFVLHFQRGSSNTFWPGLTAKNVHFSDNRRQLLGQTGGSHMMGNVITFENGGTAVFEGCRFANNVATFESTGWGAVGGGIMRLHNLTYARFTDCAFEGNELNTVAQREALGFVWIQRPNGPTLFERCVFRDNRVSAAPGVGATAVYLDSDQTRTQSVAFDSCVFDGNEGTGRAVLANQGAHVCGAVCSSTAVSRTALDVSFKDCTFQANRVTGELGAPTVAANVNALGAAVGLFFGAAASFASCTFTDNAALNTAFAPGNMANTFRAFGGAVHLNGVAATIDSGIFIGNTATGAVDARGGALGLWTSNNAVPSSTTITNTFFSSNKALATGAGARMALGGGIATACATAATCRLSLISSGLESNQAMLVDSAVTTTTVLAQGGGLYATALRTAMTIQESPFSNNVAYARPASPTTAAAVEGGGLFLLDSIASATETSFSENSAWVDNAEPGSSRVGGGGAAVVTASSANPSALTLTSSSFLLNTAGGVPRNQGGALYKDVPSQLSRSDDTKVVDMERDASAEYKSFNDVHLAQAPAVIAPKAVSTTTSRPTPSPTRSPGMPTPTSRPTAGPTQPAGTPAPTTIAGECTRANGVPSPVVLGAATQASTDLLHTALSGWRNCHGRVVFTEPGQVFTLPTGYIFSRNLTLDASGLAAPVTLRTGAPMEVSLLTFIPGGSSGMLPGIVARNIVFADHKRVRTGATGGTWAMGGVISMQGGSNTAVFESCRFRNNELFFSTNGTGGCGVGGVRIARPALARFDDCVFEDNSATCESQNAAGGAVGIVDPVGPVSFTRCRWVNNKATANIPFATVARPYASGAAVFLANEQAAAQPVTFSQCTFEGNEAHITPVNPEANFDATACGAVCGDTHVGKPALLDVAFSQCGFAGNKATAHLPMGTGETAKAWLTAYGGAVGLFAGSSVRFTECMIKENVASTDDYVPGVGTTNRVYGGGVLLNGAAGSFEATRFADNSAIGPVDARGGGLYVMGATLPNLQQGPSSVSITGSTFFGNRALAVGRAGRSAFGGALGAACSSTSATCRIPLQLVDSVVQDNSATLQETVAAVTGTVNAFARGGGLYIALPRDSVSLLGSNFSNNVAYGDAADASSALVVQGGGVYLQDATASISSVTFVQNTAWVAGAHEEASETAGGGVALLTQTSSTPTVLTLAESSFILNTAGGVPRNHGGALYKDALSTLNNEGGVRVVPMETELAGTEGELDQSLNDVVLDEPTPAFATMAVSTSAPTSRSTVAPTAVPTTGTPTRQPTQQPSTAPTASPTLPVNCAVAWGEWSACSAECGPGLETQTGAVTQKPSATGAQCPESLARTRPCQLRSCLGTVFLESGGAAGRADVVNPQEKVVLGVTLPSAAAGSAARGLQEGRELTFAWSGGDGEGFDLATMSAAELARYLLTSATDRYLAFKPHALVPGRAYVFACTVSDGVDKTTSKIAFTVNRPPSGGSFAITPAKGVAMQTPFELSAKDWVDAEGHYPLRYRFSLGDKINRGDDSIQNIQSASTRASYTGMLGGWGTGVSVTCMVEDALGATATVTKTVDIDPPPMVRSDPNRFLADQMAGTQALLSLKDATVPGSATLVRVLLSLLACTETLNDPSAASLIDQRTLATKAKSLVDSIEQVSLGLEQWSKGRSANDPNIDALEDALKMLTNLVGSLAGSVNEWTMVSTGSQYTALRVLGRTMDISAAMRLDSSSEADAVLVDALSELADHGVLRPDAEGKFRTEAVDRLLGQLHARRTASMAPGEPSSRAVSYQTVSRLAVLSSAFLAGDGNGPLEVEYRRRSLTPAGRGRMRHFLSVARGAQAGADSSNRKLRKEWPGVTLPAALVNGKLPAAGVGRDCGGKASIQTTYWKTNPYFYHPGGQALDASSLTPVVSVRVGSCDESAPRELTGLAPEEAVVVAFPAAHVPADLVIAAQQATVHNVTCDKGQGSPPQLVECPYVAGTENEQATASIAAMSVRTEAAGSYLVECSNKAAGQVSITCPKLELEPNCMYWDAAAQAWSTEGCRVVSTTLDAALAGAKNGEDMFVETVCSCQRTGAFAATVTPRLASAVPFHFAETDFPIVNHGDADGEGGAPIPQSAQAAALFVIFLAVFHIASFLIAFILYSRWGQAQLLSKHAALLLQSQGAKRLVTSLVEAEAAKKRRWSVAADGPTGATGGANARPQAFDNPIAEKMHAYNNNGNAPQRHEEAAATDDDGAKARRALYEAEQLYVAAQDRLRLFHGMEKGPSAKQLMAEVAYHEIGAFLTSKWLQQQQRLPEDEPAEQEHQVPNTNTTGQLPLATQQPHPAATLHLTIRPLAPGSAAANASAAAGEEAAAAAAAGTVGAATATKGSQSASAAVRASVTATRLRQLDLQRTVLFVVKHLVLLLVCVGRFEAPTAQFGEWVLRDCADAGAGALRPGSVCVQPQQFVFRNLIQFVLLLPLLLLLYVLLPVAIQRPRRQDQAWLRIWTDKAVLSTPVAASSSTSNAGDDEPESILSKERLAEESMGRLVAMDAELDVLFEALSGKVAAAAAASPDAESLEAVDEARREVAVAAWRRRATDTSGLCWPRPRSAGARDRLRALGKIVESGDDPFKAFDKMVLTNLLTGSSRLRALQQWLKVLFYRLALADRDPMEGEVESERAFAYTGLAVAVAGGALLLIFLICAIWYIVSAAIGWRMASAGLVLVYYIESVLFTMLVTTPLSLFLRNTGHQLLAAALESDLHALRAYLRDLRQARAAVIGDAAHMALLAQSPHNDDDGAGGHGGHSSLALTASVVSPLVAEPVVESVPTAAPAAYIRRQRLQQDGGEAGVVGGSAELSPRPDLGASNSSAASAPTAPPRSPQSPPQQAQPQRWSVGRDRNGGDSNLHRGSRDRHMI